MKRNFWSSMAVLFLLFIFAGSCKGPETKKEITLWPEIEPFQSGYLKVSDLHEIYYELCGNPNGKPVFALHGGPGGSCSPYYRQFFNPDKFLIVLHDQRGAGKSRPYAEIRENTTWDLVEDIERLRKHLNLNQIILFGGSWGSTLGVAYAETYPENVSGMVLRGIFLATKGEIDHYYHGGVRLFFPETYDSLVESIPESERQVLPQALLRRVQSQDPNQREKYSKLWTKYEYKISALEVPDRFLEGIDKGSPEEFLSFGLFENYYMTNGCFLEEGQLLRDTDKIRDIPAILINGRYDMICPPVTAYLLHQKLPKSKLVIAEKAGHWMGDKPIEKALLEAMREFE